MKKCILIVLDSVGIGELPDAANYGDVGANTLCNIKKRMGEFHLPHLQQLGLGHIEGSCFEKVEQPRGHYGKMAEVSAGKDTTTGHWEIAGLHLMQPFPVYPNGFPKDIMNAFEQSIGTKTLGNIPASGTKIIADLGEEHCKTGYPIVYTSADSVFQIAAHEEIIPVSQLYQYCEIAREILKDEHAVGRVIARPFVGDVGQYQRTANRKDFSLLPLGKTILEYLKESGKEVKAVGKIEDIFSGQGITTAVHTKGNAEGIERTLEFMKQEFEGLIFTNLVDFDMVYGHRNDVEGYAKALQAFDHRLPEIVKELHDEDLLIITADHGCDPTTDGSDHTREYVPVLVYGKMLKPGQTLGIRKTYADVAATIGEFFGITTPFHATSFWKEML